MMEISLCHFVPLCLRGSKKKLNRIAEPTDIECDPLGIVPGEAEIIL
jgi:hypothetical protein